MSRQEKGSNKEKGLSSNQKIMIAGFGIIIVLIAVIGIAIYARLAKEKSEAASGGNLVVDESNLGAIEEQLSSSVDDGMFEINMTTVWNFADGESASADAYVANGSSNHYPLSFDIIINENEKIYSSTVIPVGKQIKEIKLDKALEAGTYDAVCMYHLWQEDGTENSSFGVNIKLVVAE